MTDDPPLMVAVSDGEPIDVEQRLLPGELIPQFSAIDVSRIDGVEITALTASGSSTWRVAAEGGGARVTVTSAPSGEPSRTSEYVTAAALVALALVELFDLGGRGPAPRHGRVFGRHELGDWSALTPHVDGLVLSIARPAGEAMTVIAPVAPTGYLVGAVLADHEQVVLVPATRLDVWLRLSAMLAADAAVPS